MLDGSATMAIPMKEDKIVIIFPSIDIAYISPYPTVVREMEAQYTASKYVLNVYGSTLNIRSAIVRI